MSRGRGEISGFVWDFLFFFWISSFIFSSIMWRDVYVSGGAFFVVGDLGSGVFCFSFIPHDRIDPCPGQFLSTLQG